MTVKDKNGNLKQLLGDTRLNKGSISPNPIQKRAFDSINVMGNKRSPGERLLVKQNTREQKSPLRA